ncbi:MAG: protein translocase subunit SecD [Gammaproteobacteria bacterium]|nr:protein translocase subunit SecD [Gammaproteobacteria bacterium]
MLLNRYPLWKYILLIAIVLLGILYALPNAFRDDPSVQLSARNGNNLDPAVITQVQAALQQAQISTQGIDSSNPEQLVVLFQSLDDQLKAKDALQAALGTNYSIAVNMATTAPKWLLALGAQPMKLGLDLRGGVHFLLQVDVNSVITQQEKGDIRAIALALRNANIRYSGIRPQQDASLYIMFPTRDAMNQAQGLIQQQFPNYSAQTSQSGSNYYVTARLTPAALTQLRDYIMSQTITVLNNRVNALGVAEAMVARQGLDQISVDLPGVQDTAQASQILGGNATLEMHLVDQNADLSAATHGIVPLGSKLYYMDNGQPIVLYNQVILTGDAITNATAGFDQNGAPAVDIRATGSQVPEFHRITGENIGKQMGIVLINVDTLPQNINGKMVNVQKRTETVINAATIQSALPGSFQVTGLSSPQMSKNLAIQLRSGTTPANLIPIQERVVGPSLGESNIHHGLVSIIAGFILIVVFMTFYYRVFGLIANMALMLNLVLIVALMSLIGFTLSLPGMAGVVLTLGMAIDANVLIFERVREELRNGVTVQAAIHAGYDRAFATIVDANVTTLIVAVVLFALASAAIQAFAITLIVGLLTSMTTSILGTRAIVNLLYGSKNVKQLPIGIKY